MKRFFYLFEIDTNEGRFVLAFDKCDKYGAMPVYVRRRSDKAFMMEEDTQRAFATMYGPRYTAFGDSFSLEGSMFLTRQLAAYNPKTDNGTNDFLCYCISLYNLAHGGNIINWDKFRLYHSRLIWHPHSVWDMIKHGKNKFFKTAQL